MKLIESTGLKRVFCLGMLNALSVDGVHENFMKIPSIPATAFDKSLTYPACHSNYVGTCNLVT